MVLMHTFRHLNKYYKCDMFNTLNVKKTNNYL